MQSNIVHTTTRNGLGEITTKIYNKNEQLHYEYGPALYTDTRKEWWIEGMRHRSYGPAILTNEDNYIRAEWYFNGKRHREGKPAIIDSDGVIEYWNNGIKIS